MAQQASEPFWITMSCFWAALLATKWITSPEFGTRPKVLYVSGLPDQLAAML
jgi:hypothetical protein